VAAAESAGQASHFVKSACYQCRPCAVAEFCAFNNAGGDGNNVFDAAADLRRNHVGCGIWPKIGGGKHIGKLCGKAVFGAGNGYGRQFALCNVNGKARAG